MYFFFLTYFSHLPFSLVDLVTDPIRWRLFCLGLQEVTTWVLSRICVFLSFYPIGCRGAALYHITYENELCRRESFHYIILK